MVSNAILGPTVLSALTASCWSGFIEKENKKARYDNFTSLISRGLLSHPIRPVFFPQEMVAGIIFVSALLLGVVLGAIPADLITSLPGWEGALPSTQYSGYLPVKDGFVR